MIILIVLTLLLSLVVVVFYFTIEAYRFCDLSKTEHLELDELEI